MAREWFRVLSVNTPVTFPAELNGEALRELLLPTFLAHLRGETPQIASAA